MLLSDLLFYTIQSHLPMCGTIHSGLGPPTSINKMTQRLIYSPICWRHLLNWHLLFSEEKLASSWQNPKQHTAKQDKNPLKKTIMIINFWLLSKFRVIIWSHSASLAGLVSASFSHGEGQNNNKHNDIWSSQPYPQHTHTCKQTQHTNAHTNTHTMCTDYFKLPSCTEK